MSNPKTGRKKKMTRWLALAVAGVMVLSMLVAALIKF